MAAVEQFEQLPLKTAFLVGRRKPLSALPWWQRWLVRTIYFTIGWSTGDGIEVQVFVFDEAEAERLASKPGWFYISVPVDDPLPDATCQYGTHTFPLSDAVRKYQRRRFNNVAVNADLLLETKERAARLKI